jgi:hypothetical protein
MLAGFGGGELLLYLVGRKVEKGERTRREESGRVRTSSTRNKAKSAIYAFEAITES